MQTKQLYNVEIFEYKTGKVVSIIGTNLTEDRADRREMTGLSRCNSDYGCRSVEVKGD